MTEWEFFVKDSWGHELIYQRCEYCQEERPIQQWDIAEEDSDKITAIMNNMSYPFQIKNLMKEVSIHGKNRWICCYCLQELNLVT
jgi:hypothetical protein